MRSKRCPVPVLAVLSAGLILLAGSAAEAKLKLVCSIPDLCDIAKKVGGPYVSTRSLSKGYQDPHFVDPRPSFALALSNADLLLHVGLELEVGWLPPLITGARNGKILTGHLGNLDCSTLVKIREVPTQRLTRSQGDLHPGGNPHYWADPRNGVRIGFGISKRLAKLDPAHAAQFKARYRRFALNLIARMRKWRKMLKPYRLSYVVPYHQSWVYFLKFAGLKRLGTVERLPGVKPSAAHLANLYRRIRANKARLVISESYYPKKTARTVARKFGMKYLTLAAMAGGVRGANSYVKAIDYNVRTIVAALKALSR